MALQFCRNRVRQIGAFILLLSVSSRAFADFLVLVGSIVLIAGVVLTDPIDVINNSVIGGGGHGIMRYIPQPERIAFFLQSHNKCVLGLVILCCGYLTSVALCPRYKEFSLAKSVLIFVVAFYLATVFIAGYTRHNVIYRWSDVTCKYRWYVTDLLTESCLQDTLDEYAKSNQFQDGINDVMSHLLFVVKALNITTNITIYNKRALGLQEVKSLQNSVRGDVHNVDFFYYLFRPKKLLEDVFV